MSTVDPEVEEQAAEEDDRFTADDMPPGMASFTFVLLRRPDDAPEFSEEELERLQAGHLAHLDKYRATGATTCAIWTTSGST